MTVNHEPDVHYRVAIGDAIPCGAQVVRRSTANPAEVTCPGCHERRTVGLEVLTDELRRSITAPELSRYPDARVATVIYLNGDRHDIMDSDAEWRAQFGDDRPALILTRMLGAASAWAADLGAELAMPTPDVLAALSGQPVAALPTEAQYPDEPDRSHTAVAAELRILAGIIEAHPDFPVQSYGLSVGQATDGIGGGAAVRRIAELLGLPVEESVRSDGRRSWSTRRCGALSAMWSYIEFDTHAEATAALDRHIVNPGTEG